MTQRKGLPTLEKGLTLDIEDDSESDDFDQEWEDIRRVWQEPDPQGPVYLKDERPKQSFSLWRLFQRYTCASMTVMVALFLVSITHYNARQLQRIKDDLGMTSTREHLPEMWWEKALMYKLIVRSFQDTNMDGIGDFQGVLNHLDHLLYIGADAVVLSSVFLSPFKELGKDVSSFTRMDPSYGTLDEFRSIVSSCRDKNIKVLLEISLNQCSKQHEWFSFSQKKRGNYSDYFVWHHGVVNTNGSRSPPNNWQSRHGGSAWSYDIQRDMYYYHYYSMQMPDLNFHNPALWDEARLIFEYWISLGVDGFILQDVDILYEVEDVLLDEPLKAETLESGLEHDNLNHIYTVDTSFIHDQLMLLRDWFDHASDKYDKKLAFIVDPSHSSFKSSLQYYLTGAHTVLIPTFTSLTSATFNGADVYELIDSFRNLIPPNSSPLWMLSHTELGRFTSKLGRKYQNAMNMLQLLLPGASFAYMGDELALPSLTVENIKHLYEDPMLASQAVHMGPFPWANFPQSGFSKVDKPWLPLLPDFKQYSVETMSSSTIHATPLHIFGKLGQIRREISFRNGEFHYSVITENIFSFITTARNNAPYLVALNLGKQTVSENFSLTAGVQYGKVIIHAPAVGDSLLSAELSEGKTVELTKVTLKPGESVVLLLLLDVIMEF